MNTDTARPVEVLLVEDNPGDVRLMQEALKASKIRNNLHVVNDGEEAMLFLRRQSKYTGIREPDLVFLDLNLPGKNGREVLAEVKQDAFLRHIPVVILTTSSDEEDIFRTYNLDANCFVTKPVNHEQFIKMVHMIEDLWFTIVKLPRKT